MKYIDYREKRDHGTKEFPFAVYHVTDDHPRYNMIHHWHTECELMIVRSGQFQLSTDGKEHILNEGDCSLIMGGSLHGGVPDDCIYDCLVFDMAALLKGCPECTAAIQPMLSHEKKFSAVFKKDSATASYAKAAIDAMIAQDTGYEFFVMGNLFSMLGSAVATDDISVQNEVAVGDMKKIKKFKKVLSYIEEHYREPITLADMAKQCGMNRNYFCRAFKEYTSKTPVEYLNYYRIESACEQIIGTDDKLIDIAMNCGFNDYSYFIKVFKNHKGLTPRDFCRKSF
ncbi:MAG: helix-turn-helix transcriptional regulator [Eubacterium sp.]|nr:helix-turn-helix transcriptional regulator [Eubacterium sp.]